MTNDMMAAIELLKLAVSEKDIPRSTARKDYIFALYRECLDLIRAQPSGGNAAT
jgi:hypothetical protein